MKAENLGINIVGYIRSEIGLGEAVRANIRSLRAVGVETALRDIPLFVTETPDGTFMDLREDSPYPVDLVQVNMDHDTRVRTEFPAMFREDRFKVGFWSWELEAFPGLFHSSYRFYDEIWTPSAFARDAVQAASPAPVRTFPHSLDFDALSRARSDRGRFGISPQPFVFLSSFDFCSCLERKNPLGLVRAFSKAFGSDNDALLVLKSSHSRLFPQELQRIREAAGSGNILVLDNVMSRTDTYDLIASADCYVSLHRAEGFGLPLAEAMALGKPVIATGYSGNMDFMSESDSFLVSFRRAPVGKHPHVCPYPEDAFWAEPDQEHAVQLLRKVREDRQHAEDVGRRGRVRVREILEPAAIGSAMKQRLGHISNSRIGVSLT